MVLAEAHGDCDGGVVEKEPVRLPGGRGLGDPVDPPVDEAIVDEIEIDYAKENVSGCLAVPVAERRVRQTLTTMSVSRISGTPQDARDGRKSTDLQYVGRFVDRLSGEHLWVFLPAREIRQTYLAEDVGEKHDEHQGMLGGHRARHVRKTWPGPRRIQRMVGHQPLVGDHRDPYLLFLARPDSHHAPVVVEGQASGLAVGPETVYS